MVSLDPLPNGYAAVMSYGSPVPNMAPLAIGRVASRISLRNAIYICVPRMTENLNLGLAESPARGLVMIYVVYLVALGLATTLVLLELCPSLALVLLRPELA